MAAVFFALAEENDPEVESVGTDGVAERRDTLFFVSQPRPIESFDALDLEKEQVERPSAPAQQVDVTELDEAVAAYAESLNLIERDGGAWSLELVENLAALAGLNQRQGRHDEAANLFNRAIHISRIGGGLNAVDQVKLVERLIASEQALENWEAVDNKYEYLFYLQERAYGRKRSAPYCIV